MAPVVFISYSHDSEIHKTWVLKLATELREKGVDAILDQWDLSLGQDTSAFMQRGISESDRMILGCTENCVKKADGGSGGVGYERLIVTAELVENIDTKKFIPLVRNNGLQGKLPKFLGPRLYIDFSDDAQYPAKGRGVASRDLGCAGRGEASAWTEPVLRFRHPERYRSTIHRFAKEAGIATANIAKVKLSGHMELRFSLHAEINKSQLELLNAAKASQIRTFGWPIGLVAKREEYRPRPHPDGLRAEISIDRSAMTGLPSYDYWALRNNGDFYLLQSLFEDDRGEKKIFFTTRIVRVTESLMFTSNLYKTLGVAPETRRRPSGA